jgi:hypothetical protein
MKICPVGAKLFHADGWTAMMKLIVVFCKFVNVSKNGTILAPTRHTHHHILKTVIYTYRM